MSAPGPAFETWDPCNGRSWKPDSVCSKGLANADKVLGRLHTRYRVKVVPQIDADRPHWCCVAQPEAHIVRIERGEIVKADSGKYVATIVENDHSQTLLDRHRDPRFRVDNQLFVSAA